MEVYVSGRSLGSDRNMDDPNVQMQYAVLQTEDAPEIVEKMYFDRLLDFVYVELMKGLQKGFLPKRCPNCGSWFVQEPGMDFNYCAKPAPLDPTKLCRDIGATNSFLDKKKESRNLERPSESLSKILRQNAKEKHDQGSFLLLGRGSCGTTR